MHGPWVNHWQVGHFAPYTGEIYNPHWAWEVRRKALASMEKQRAGSAILGHNLRRHINSTHQLSSLLVFGQFCGFQLQVPILRDRGGPNAAVKIQVRLCVRYAPRWRLARSRSHFLFLADWSVCGDRFSTFPLNQQITTLDRSLSLKCEVCAFLAADFKVWLKAGIAHGWSMTSTNLDLLEGIYTTNPLRTQHLKV